MPQAQELEAKRTKEGDNWGTCLQEACKIPGISAHGAVRVVEESYFMETVLHYDRMLAAAVRELGKHAKPVRFSVLEID